MRAVLGFVSLLIVLAVIGMLAVKQMKAIDRTVGSSFPPAQTSAETPAAAAPPASTVRAEAAQVQRRVADQVGQTLQQGAAARREEADK